MIDDNDKSNDDNVLHGAFDSAKAINGTPINEPTNADSSHPPKTKSIKILKQGEDEMAEVDTNLLHQDHSDIRREAAQYSADERQEIARGMADSRYATATGFADARFDGATQTNEVVKETLKAGWSGVDATKDARYEVATRVEDSADRLSNQATQFYIAAQKNATDAATDIAGLKVLTDANAGRISMELALGIEKAAAAAMLSSEKIAAAVALGQSVLSKEVFQDGQKTRDLINDLKYHDLNRSLIERNTELVEEREGRRHWRYFADQNQNQGQFAQLQSQIQAFQSQLQETRQGMVNFGTMAGVGQTSTSNNVR